MNTSSAWADATRTRVAPMTPTRTSQNGALGSCSGWKRGVPAGTPASSTAGSAASPTAGSTRGDVTWLQPTLPTHVHDGDHDRGRHHDHEQPEAVQRGAALARQ